MVVNYSSEGGVISLLPDNKLVSGEWVGKANAAKSNGYAKQTRLLRINAGGKTFVIGSGFLIIKWREV